jgi:AhpD family alkylhydroperoxidase
MTLVRIPFDVAPEQRQAMRGLEKAVSSSSLAKELIELVKLRVSMINGCAYCIHMHWRNLRGFGESEQRLYSLSAWREQSGYSARERAALAWAETVTAVADTGVPDTAFAEVSAACSQKEVAELTYAVVAINSWNRLCVAFRIEPEQALPERA